MLTDNHQSFLFRALRANRCLLFVGAGFSADASNAVGSRIPAGDQLAAELWRWLGYEGDYDRTPLSEMFEAALRSGRPMADLKGFLEDRLLARHVPHWYEIPTQIFWHRIYGTNADDVIERAFAQMGRPSSVTIVNAVLDDYDERDQFLRSIQYIKLNGSLPGRPDRLTFSTREYARRSAQFDQWYDHFVRDYAFHPTIFVGSELREPLFWQAIESRHARGRNPEERPASFLVTPAISPAKLPTLKELNIHHVPATGAEFFAWMADHYDFPDQFTTLRTVAPEAAELISGEKLHSRDRDAIQELLATFPRVPMPAPEPGRQRTYFLGVPPRWADLVSGFDAPRDLTRHLLEAIEEVSRTTKLGVFGLVGPAGSGKSTILMRLALTLRQQGREVFFSEGSERPDIAAIVQALRVLGSQSVLFVDNAQLLGPLIYKLIEEVNRLDNPPLLVFGARMNVFERQLKAIEGRADAQIFELGDLSHGEITALLAVLEQHAQLGRLAAMSPGQRANEFLVRAKKQILVAMREATQGYGFDEIVRDEFNQLDSHETRIMFLCAAVATAELIDLSREQLLACAEEGPAEALVTVRRNLRGLLIEDDAGRMPARHPIIAELIVNILASRTDVAQTYVRLLNTLAHDIYPGKGRSSRAWRLFVRLIDHKRIYSRFAQNIELARSIYLSVDRYFQNDGHFWLQFANLEIEYGEAPNARPHLAYAESLMPGHPFVLTTRAHLALRESRDVESHEKALALRHEAEEILLEQIKRTGPTDEYPYHVYISGMLRWLERWAIDVTQLRQELENLRALARQARFHHAYSRRIREIAELVEHRYLMTAVPEGAKSPSPK